MVGVVKRGESLAEEAITEVRIALELATKLQTQIEAGLREMIMQGSSRTPYHQIKPIEMEHAQH